ncbi:MXAN_6230/SCO0854 family RING domain-containing protein [Massilia sp. Root351]|uniref:MXAN_6230/SCO0854 family RING domain-containing protein n=1 Tax=Massilia sp. Root351 TaxID=1736522 RepID=UPI0009EA68EA|nr:MXAN_6230/SCO0854 family RING domain-containing protein [Massilia sp. Root351]
MTSGYSATDSLLLRRHAQVCVSPGTASVPDSCLEAFEVNLAGAGYAVSSSLRERLRTRTPQELGALQAHLFEVLLAKVGGQHKHVPLFRHFPDGVPDDTFDLWCRKVLSHFMQAEGQPCLHCGQTSTTHVLNPCRHVVCDACFDGSNYSACPVCEQHVDTSSPFFKPAPERTGSGAPAILALLTLGESLEASARELFLSLCVRKQVLSPVDKDDFTALVRDRGAAVLDWLPAEIPVRENVATLFGELLKRMPAEPVLAAARRYFSSATDVARLIAAYSDADVALQGQTVYRARKTAELRGMAKYKHMFSAWSHWGQQQSIQLPVLVKRFKVAKLGRPLRRALLACLESMNPDALTEDMLRHRSYWVWLGEFLHPHEYRARFPNTARAFEVVRKKAPDGTRPAPFQGYYSKLESAALRQDAGGMTALLAQRPGELARRFDHALRVAGSDAGAVDCLLAELSAAAPRLATPVLLTLCSLLPTRAVAGRTRVYWPKGKVSKGVFAPDERPALPAWAIERALAVLESELLRRFAGKERFPVFLIDTRLKDVMVPFNERTASRSAIQMPRGSAMDVALAGTMRLFLHWCEPQSGGSVTDLDLSVAFYDKDWRFCGTCSYYQLKFDSASGGEIARSAGDLRSAPYPGGATEFIDIDCGRAQADGIRYAVAVLNNYAGMPFEQLEHAYAGLMQLDDPHGAHFDARAVKLKFDLQGENGIFMPLVLDLSARRMHWLDVYSKGELAFNNADSSNAAITAICPTLIGYFASGIRPSLYQLVLLHAAARADRVVLRGEQDAVFERRGGEDGMAFLKRLRSGAGAPCAALPDDRPVCAALLEGDIALPAGSQAYILQPGISAGTLSPADFLS